MSQLSTAAWEALYGTSGTQFPDNTTGSITELIMRTFGKNLSDSFWNKVSDLQGLTTATGTDTYAVTGGITSYISGFTIFVKFTNANTGAATLNVNGLGAKSIKKSGSTALASGDISGDQILLLQYDGTNFQVVGGGSSGGGSGTVNSGTAGQLAYYAGSGTAVSGATTGTGVLTALGVNVGTAGAFVVNGGALGTPSGGTLTNATGLPISTGVSGLGSGVATFLGAPSWTNFNSMITGTAPFWNTSGSTTVTTPTISGKPTWTQSAESSTNTFQTFTQAAHTGGTPVGILFTGGAHTTLTAATESNDVHFNLNRTVQFNGGGSFTLQRAVNISAPEYSATSSTTITHAATLSLRTPTAGTNMTITNASALLVTDGSTNAQVALNPPNINFGAIVFGSSSKASTGSIGPASKSTGVFQASGTSLRFHSDMTAATVGAFQFTTFSTTTPLNSGASIFINASPAYTQSTSVGADHSVIRTGFTFTHAGTTGNRLTAFLADPTFNITNTNASTIEGFTYTPVQTALNSASKNIAFRHNSGFVQWESVLSPAQITANQNDYNPTGLNNGGAPNGASILRLTSDASRDVTSIVGGITGRLLIVANVGSQNIVLKNDDGATGTAANRFALNADITLLPGQSVMLWYDGTSSRWRANRN